MRVRLCLFATLGILGYGQAQGAVQTIEYSSGLSNNSTRVGLPGVDPGDVTQRFSHDDLGCMSQMVDVGGRLVHRVNMLLATVQDELSSTPELITLCILAEDPAIPGQPNPIQGNELLRTTPVATPTGAATRMSWFMSVNLSTPYDNLPQGSDFFVGVGLPANGVWTADGLSVHTGNWTANPVDNPYLPQSMADYAHSIDRIVAGQPVVRGENVRLMRLAYRSAAPELRVGADIDPALQVCPNPNYGAGGFRPDWNSSRLDGFAWRLQAANQPNVPYAILGMTAPLAAPGYATNFSQGLLCLDLLSGLPLIDLGQYATDPLGRDERIFITFPNFVGRPLGVFSVQAFLLDPVLGVIHATNGAALRSL